MNILLITYDISPYRGSEASVSWNYVINMMSTNKLFVLYGKGKDEIQSYLKTSCLPNVEFINIPFTDAKGHGLIMDIMYNLNYRRWHYQTYQHALDLKNMYHIEIVHYLNPIGFKEPGYCWKIKGVPYVWGPIQCVENRPFALYSALSMKGKVNAITRRIVHNAMLRFLPRVKKALHRADIVFAATPNTVRQLKEIHHKDSIYLPENGIVSINRKVPISYDGNCLNLIWVGAVGERKALVLLIEALNQLESTKWHLDVCGDGSERHKLQTKAIEYGINDNISWHGNISRDKVQDLFANAHLHIISSLGEATTTVLFEAMSWAVPTMTLDHCGMSGVVCEKCGIKIPIISYSKVVADMSNKIKQILDNPDIINRLSNGVIHCSENFMWIKRVEVFNYVYKKIAEEYRLKDTSH